MEFKKNPTIDRISAEQALRKEKERKAETYKERAKKVYDIFYELAYSHGRVESNYITVGARRGVIGSGRRAEVKLLIAEGSTKDESQPVKITQSLGEKQMPWQTLEIPGLSICIGQSVVVNETDSEVIELTEADVTNLSQLADQLDKDVDWDPVDPEKKPLPDTEYPIIK